MKKPFYVQKPCVHPCFLEFHMVHIMFSSFTDPEMLCIKSAMECLLCTIRRQYGDKAFLSWSSEPDRHRPLFWGQESTQAMKQSRTNQAIKQPNKQTTEQLQLQQLQQQQLLAGYNEHLNMWKTKLIKIDVHHSTSSPLNTKSCSKLVQRLQEL